MNATLKAIGLLGPHFRRINTEWREKLKPLAKDQKELLALQVLNPQLLFENLRTMKLSRFNREFLHHGENLAALDVPLEHAITASREYLKLCLQRLPNKRDANTRSMALSLVRLSSVGQLFLISGYTAQRKLRLSETEKGLSEAEERLRGLARIITNVYDQERRRISRDLHDQVGHDLIVLKLYLEMILRNLPRRNIAHVSKKLREAVSLVSKAVEKVRRISYELGPAISDELGFVSALKIYARQFARRTGIRVNLRASKLKGKLPSTHEMTLYRILQGALSNVLRHSQAKNVKVSVATVNRSVAMTVEDDGIGFAVEKTLSGKGRAFGLTTMRERVELLGGEVRIESWRSRPRNKKHGTKIEVSLPLLVVGTV